MKKLKAFLVLIAITVLPQQLLAEPRGAVAEIRPDVKGEATKPSEGGSKGARNVNGARSTSATVRISKKRSQIKASLNKKIANLNAKKFQLQQELLIKQAELKNFEQTIKESNEEITNLLNQLALIP